MKFRLDPLSQSGISAVTTTVVTGGGSSSSGNSHDQVTLAGEDYLSLSGQQITANPIDLDNLSATGTPSGSTFLRGDNTWATPAGSGDVSKVGTPVNNQVGVWTGDGTIEGDTDLTFDTTTNTLTTVNIAPSGTVDGRDIATDGTKLDGIEAGADVTDAVNVDAAGATMNSDTSLAGNGYFLDEDDMVSNSATKVPSQQSVKAYVDAQTSGAINSVVAGNNIDVDATDPANPVVSVETLNLADISDVTASASEVNVLDGIPGTLTATELGYVDGVTSAIQSQLDGKQPLDAELTAVAGLVDNGLIARTGAGAMASRTLTGTANKITVTNGDGSIGDPTITIPDTPTLVTPTIASFVNATHNHQNAAGGGQITDAALSSAVTVAKGGTGVTTLGSGNVLVGAGTSAVTTTKAAPTGDFVGTTDTQTLTNKTIDGSQLVNTSVGPSKLNLAPATSYVATDESTTSTTYADLSTVQSVTVTVGANGLALAMWYVGSYNVAAVKYVSVAVSGSSTVGANNDWSVRNDSASAFKEEAHHLFTSLTPGSNTFTLKFRTASGTARFFERRLTVIPL